MSKPSTPVRRSKVGPGRPGSAGGEIPLTASMEVLTPDPSVPPLMAALDVGRSSDLTAHANGSKPRTPGSAAPPLTRTRSTDGRRSALLASGPLHQPHEVIPLTATTAKSASSNHVFPNPQLLLSSPHVSGVGVGSHVQSEVGFSQRFNPVTESADYAAVGGGSFTPMLQPQPHSQSQAPEAEVLSASVAATPTGARVVLGLGGNAAAVAQRVASAGSSRRYAAAAAAESVSASHMQTSCGTMAGQGPGQGGEEGGVGVSASGALRPGTGGEADVPGTPGSVASGRMGGAGVFFTDLHRSFGDGSRLRLRGSVADSQDLSGVLEDGEGEGGRHRQPRASTLSSRLNPMQSPTSSEDGEGVGGEDDAEFAEYAGEEPQQPAAAQTATAAGDGLGLLAEGSTSALTEYGNPLQTPQDSRLGTPLLPAADHGSAAAAAAASVEASANLLTVIHDLYVTEPEQPPQEAAAAESSRPATAASGAAEGPAAEGDEAEALAASRAAVAALSARLESQQSKRRTELGEYMEELQGLKDESGNKLVELPADWGVMLERLFRQRRAEFETLQGWMGPRRFEDLPINQLPKDHPDPKVEEGLARIRELDSVLNDKLIAALISHRETFPEQWAEQERRRLDRHSKGVEDALKRERQKRLRAARISRAVTSLDGPADDVRASQGSMQSLAEQPSSVYSRLFTLKPEEEALVEAVMQRNDDEGAAINPFDLESAGNYATAIAAATAATPAAAAAKPPLIASGASGTGGAHGAAPNIVLTDPDDIDLELELDMMLPSSAAASCCATPSGPVRSSTAGLRPLSARATDRDRAEPSTPGWAMTAGEGSRPTSATSNASFSLSRPGTAGSIGGMSAIAAAALRGHPAMRAGLDVGGGGGGGSSGLLPSRVYEDPRAAARALRVINARLAAFESEHLWDESGALADFKSISQQQQLPKAEASEGTGNGAASTAGPGSAAGGTAVPRASSPTRSVRSGVGGGGGPPASVTGVSVTEGGQRDYLREERLAKELAGRERDVDAALRSLKTGEVVRLGEATLKALVEQCRRLQELNEHRRKIEEAEAAARKAQQQRQQVLASANGRGPGSPRGTPKGGTTPHGGPSATTAASSHAAGTTSASGTAASAAANTHTGGAGRTGAKGTPPQPPGRPPGAVSAPTAADGTASKGAAAGGVRAGAGAAGASGGGQRHASTGSSAGRAGSAGDRSHSSAAAGGGAPTPSRRASDPALSGSQSSTAAGDAGAAGKAAGTNGAAASKAGKTVPPAAPPSGGAGSTPPKAKPAAAKSAAPTPTSGQPTAASASSSLPASATALAGNATGGTAAASISASTSSSTVFSSLADIGGLPPPPPPPPP